LKEAVHGAACATEIHGPGRRE